MHKGKNMKRTLIASLVAAAFAAPAIAADTSDPAAPHAPVILLQHHIAANEAPRAGGTQADAWQRWADEFSHEMRASMGTMFAPRMGSAKVVFGLTGGISHSDQTFESGNSFELHGGNIGAYAGLYAGGFFLNGLVKADRYDATVMSSTAFFREETQATTWGAKSSCTR